MPITAGSAILQSDIATIVSSINSEITRRHPNSLSALSAPTQGNVALATDAIALITALTTLNTTHKNVTTAGIQTHSDSGGHTKTLTASASNFIAGSSKMLLLLLRLLQRTSLPSLRKVRVRIPPRHAAPIHLAVIPT